MKKNLLFCTISLLYIFTWNYYSKMIEIAQGGNGLGGVLILCYAALIYTIFKIIFIYLMHRKCKRIELLFYILIYAICIFPFIMQLFSW